MTICAIDFHCNSTRLVICAVIALGSGIAHAVVNQEQGRGSTPVVLKCRIENTFSEQQGSLTNYTATCEVLEVVRSTTAVVEYDVVTISYVVDNSAFDQQVDEKDAPPLPDPAPAAVPRPLHDRQIVMAYLRPATNEVDNRIYIPNLGSDSFETIALPPSRSWSAGCRETPEHPFMANEKICEAERLAQLTQILNVLIDEIALGIERERSTNRAVGDTAMDASLTG